MARTERPQSQSGPSRTTLWRRRKALLAQAATSTHLQSADAIPPIKEVNQTLAPDATTTNIAPIEEPRDVNSNPALPMARTGTERLKSQKGPSRTTLWRRRKALLAQAATSTQAHPQTSASAGPLQPADAISPVKEVNSNHDAGPIPPIEEGPPEGSLDPDVSDPVRETITNTPPPVETEHQRMNRRKTELAEELAQAKNAWPRVRKGPNQRDLKKILLTDAIADIKRFLRHDKSYLRRGGQDFKRRLQILWFMERQLDGVEGKRQSLQAQTRTRVSLAEIIAVGHGKARHTALRICRQERQWVRERFYLAGKQGRHSKVHRSTTNEDHD